MKVTKHTLEHIELITTGDTALFEINLVVSMNDWGGDDNWGDEDSEVDLHELGALGWLMNLLHLASEGHDIQTGAKEFLRSTMTLNETRVHLCKVEQVGYNIDEIGETK
jgi:hypothetical protein